MEAKKIDNNVLVRLYGEMGSVHKVAKAYGISHSTVYDRLKRLGKVKPSLKNTGSRLRAILGSYAQYRDAGNLQELADAYGILKTNLCRLARKHGITDKNHAKAYIATWKYATEVEINREFDSWGKSGLCFGEFCKNSGHDDLGLSRAMLRIDPAKYRRMIEEMFPETTKYYVGRELEFAAADELSHLGYLVARSYLSRTPADLTATRGGRTLLIQCRLRNGHGVKFWNNLVDLAEKHKAIPILAVFDPSGKKIAWTRITGKKDGSRKPVPHVPFSPELLGDNMDDFPGFG